MLQIKTTGVEDFIDGSANIKALVIGGPGVGKTRMSSYWPKPIFLDCENGRGSLADRNMPYAEIKSSKDMLDALEYLKRAEMTPKAQRQFQTVVVDTADSFQRIVKDEWVRQTQAQSFSGFDAWGYLDAKMQLLFTRLLNLDFNVIVLVHYKDKTYKDGDNTVRELTLQLQGAIADQVFNDFGLVGWLGTYWATGEEGRVQKRGLTFQPTPDKPFLKDRFNVTPKWMDINFADADYQQLFEAFFNRPEFEELAAGDVVGEIPDADGRQATPSTVSPPADGGPLPPRAPAEVPLEKMLKDELVDRAKSLGLQVRGNMLKDELVTAIRTAQEKASQPASVPTPEAVTKGTDVGPDPSSPGSSQTSSPSEPADAAAASDDDSGSTATSSGPAAEPAQQDPVQLVQEALGGQVISEEPADPPAEQSEAAPSAPVAKPAAPKGPSVCADCSKDLSEDWSDSAKRDYIRLSFFKHKRYLCASCNATASK